MTNPDEINSLLERVLALPDGTAPTADDREALRALMQERPYLAVVPLLLLRHSPDITAHEREALRQRVAVSCGCRNTLAMADYGDEWSKFYPDAEAPAPQQTFSVIDTFLSTYGSTSPEEEALLERMIFNPTPDYAEILAREEQENLPPESDAGISPDSQEARINAFIRSQHPAATQAPSLMPEPAGKEAADSPAPVSRAEHTDDSLLSESLAKIFIKQGRYERAHEIILGISLKYPKKSAYFADQLRFLKKLIINQRCLAARKAGGDTEK